MNTLGRSVKGRAVAAVFSLGADFLVVVPCGGVKTSTTGVGVLTSFVVRVGGVKTSTTGVAVLTSFVVRDGGVKTSTTGVGDPTSFVVRVEGVKTSTTGVDGTVGVFAVVGTTGPVGSMKTSMIDVVIPNVFVVGLRGSPVVDDTKKLRR